MRRMLTLIVLIAVLFLNISFQSHPDDVFVLPSDYMTGSDDAFPDWTNELQEHQPIVISSDADFADQDWAGSGSESDPFIIKNLRISALYSSIMIVNTTVHFEIR